MKFANFVSAALVAYVPAIAATALLHGPTGLDALNGGISKRDTLQDVVTWDEHSLMIHGERIMIFSAEMHPFRYGSP